MIRDKQTTARKTQDDPFPLLKFRKRNNNENLEAIKKLVGKSEWIKMIESLAHLTENQQHDESNENPAHP